MTARKRTLCLAVALLAAACARREDAGASASARRYPIAGVIRGVDPGKREVTLAHDRVEGLMEAMTMPFPVRMAPGDLAGIAAGDRVSGTLVMDGPRFWLEGLRRESPSAAASENRGGAASATPRPNRAVAVGSDFPDFALTDQSGKRTRLSDFRGEPVAVTFLYTRCPVATACPMTTAKFSKLDAMLAREKFGELLSVTVDPEHDTPAVLADYARRAGAQRWRFLTGDPRAVADVAEKFGVLYYPDKGQVVHQQAVAVIDRAGRLANIYYGEDWEPEHIYRDMQKARNG